MNWFQFAENEGGRWRKWEEQGDKGEIHMGKVKSCLRFESIVALGLGNLGAIMWSEMADSKAVAYACLTPLLELIDTPITMDNTNDMVVDPNDGLIDP